MLKDSNNARKSYQTILDEFKDFENEHKAATAGLEGLDYLSVKGLGW
jgi:hypothetical protein